jgi:hypothetical protein
MAEKRTLQALFSPSSMAWHFQDNHAYIAFRLRQGG